MTQGDIPGTTTLRWRTAAALAGALLLLGCTPPERPDPTGEPTSPAATASPTPSPSATASAVELPQPSPEMERTDEVGAVAAAEYFMELHQHVLATGDLTEWKLRTDLSNCGFCQHVAAQVEADAERGVHLRLGTLQLHETDVVGFDSTFRVHAVRVAYSTPGGDVVGADGTVVDAIRSETGALLLDVARGPDGWRLLGAQRLDPDAEEL